MEFQKVKKILAAILLLNWLVALVKILVGFLSGSLGVLTDGFHSLFDGASNIIGLAGVKMAERPEDSSHPYGHRKFESLASLGIAFLILITAYEFFKRAIDKISNPTVPNISLWGFIAVGLAFTVDLLVYRYENTKGKKLKSAILVADSLHTKTHLLTTPSVLLGMILIRLGLPILDPLIALFVIFMLVKLAWDIVSHTTTTLCDQSFIDESEIQRIAAKIDGIHSAHQIRTRGDEHYVFLDMQISLDPDLSVSEAHQISHALKSKIMQDIPQIKDVVINIEPAQRMG